ncbi:hypothetical protein PYCC9005_004982 [Savitreella phatthalungensis]
MSLNWLTVTDDEQLVPLEDEEVLTRLEQVHADVPGIGSAPQGIAWVTTKRIAFCRTSKVSSSNATDAKSWIQSYLPALLTGAQSPAPQSHTHLDSLSIPLARIRKTSLEQPLFGANAYVVEFVGVAGGGWITDSPLVVARFTCVNGGSETFVRAVANAARQFSELARQKEEANALPAYEP